MTKNVKPVQSTTYTLQAAYNPIYFQSGTDITTSGAAGIYGASTTNWTVTNAGTIAATNLSHNSAIQIKGAGVITNNAGGVATAHGTYARAVYLGGDGQVSNAGLLAAYGSHVQGILTKGNVTATNTGSIKVENSSSDAHASGVNLQDGGAFTNQTGGSIYAYGYHVDGVQAYLTGAVTNSGAITAKANASGHASGVQLDANGSLVNQSGGTITASGLDSIGVEMNNGGTATNYGAISVATNSARFGFGVYLENGGDFHNKSTGTVTASGSYISGVYALAGGGVYNDGSITVSGHDASTVHFKAVGELTNTGTIGASGYYISAVYAAKGITLTNSGTISDAVTSGKVGGNAVDLIAGGTVTNQSGGLITASGKYISGIYASAGADVYNYSGISVSGNHASGMNFQAASTVVNTGSITATGQYISGIYTKAAVTVTNSGSISVKLTSGAAHAAGVDLASGGQWTNQKTGSVYAYGRYAYGAYLANGAVGANYGSVSIVNGSTGSCVGVSTASGAVFTNESTGSITGSGHYIAGVTAAAGGSIINHGAITVSGTGSNGVFFSNGGSLTNDATISATSGEAGVWAENAGTVTNASGGAITGGHAGLTHANPFFAAAGAALTLTNQSGASIKGDTGVFANGVGDSIVNAGSIAGTTVYTLGSGASAHQFGDGVFFGQASSSLNNQTGGTISGARYGVYVAGASGTVTNAGAISGADGAIKFVGGGANSLTLSSGATLTGDVIGSTASGAVNTLVLDFTASQVSETINASGAIVVTSPDGTDTFENFTTIDLSDATIAVTPNVLTEYFANGNKTISNFNITGEPYTHTIANLGANGMATSETFYAADNSTYYAYTGSVTVAGFSSRQSLLDTIPGGFVVSDSAPNIIAALTALNADSHVATLTVSSGSATLASGAINAPTFTQTGSSTTLTIAENLTYAGSLLEFAGATLSIASGDILTLKGNAALGGTISGLGGLSLTAGSSTINSAAKLTQAKLTISGTAAVTLNESLAYAGALTVGAGSSLSLSSGDILSLTGTSTLGGAVTGLGALTIAGGTTTVANTAALSTARWTVSGSGTAAIAGALISYGGVFTLAASATTSIASKDTLRLTGTSNISGAISGAGALSIAGGAATFLAGSSVTAASWALQIGGATTILGALTYAGTFSLAAVPTLGITSGAILTLEGSSTLSGLVKGAGTLAFQGGTATVGGGAVMNVADWSIQGTAVTVAKNFVYGGAFTAGSGAVLTVSGTTAALTLQAHAVFNNATINGAGAMVTAGAVGAGSTSLANLTIGGGVAWTNIRTITENGGGLTLGDVSNGAVKLTNAKAGVFDITDDHGVALVGTTASIANAGIFEKTAGSGDSAVAPAIANTGLITSTSGELDLQGAITGAGILQVGAGGKLQVDGAVAATQSLTYASGAGTFSLNDLDVGGQQLFHGTIHGWAANDKIDVGSAFGANPLFSFVENGGHTGGVLNLSGGGGTAAIAFSGLGGVVTNANFTEGVDSAGGATLTFHA